MLTQLIDLTRLCVIKEIQHILVDSSDSSEERDNLILKNPIYQQQIVEYVLSKIEHRYLKIENLTEIPKEATEVLPQCPMQELGQIRKLLESGILSIGQQLLKQIEKNDLSSTER